jgi:hypothetical protein
LQPLSIRAIISDWTVLSRWWLRVTQFTCFEKHA